jgi:hypothetical protein
MQKRHIVLLLSVLAVACRAGESQPADRATTDAPHGVVDSIFPVEEEVRRFRTARNLGETSKLNGGASSRDELVQRFITALETSDTAALRGLVIDAGEYIDLYYPTSIYYKAPYKQSPELNWFLMQENSNKGFVRLLQRYLGKPTGFRGYTCVETKTQGPNRIHDRCAVAWTLEPSTMRVFSTIIDRDGQFKFMSYANDM